MSLSMNNLLALTHAKQYLRRIFMAEVKKTTTTKKIATNSNGVKKTTTSSTAVKKSTPATSKSSASKKTGATAQSDARIIAKDVKSGTKKTVNATKTTAKKSVVATKKAADKTENVVVNAYHKTVDGVKHAGEYVVDGCKKVYHKVDQQTRKVVEMVGEDTKEQFREMQDAVCKCTDGNLMHKDDAEKIAKGVRRMCNQKNISRGEYLIGKINIFNDDINQTIDYCARTIKSFGNDSTKK